MLAAGGLLVSIPLLALAMLVHVFRSSDPPRWNHAWLDQRGLRGDDYPILIWRGLNTRARQKAVEPDASVGLTPPEDDPA